MASSSDTDYLPLPGATSEVWKYFGFPAINGKHSNEYLSYILFIIIIIGKFIEPDKKKRTSVHCKLCPKVLKYSGCTTNLRYHLELSHKTQFDLLNKPKERNQSSGTNQATIDVLFEKATPMERSSPCKTE